MTTPSPLSGLFRAIFRSRAFLPVSIFLGLICVLLVSLHFTERPPLLESITPDIGKPGAVMVLKGKHFGKQRSESSVMIAGQRPTSSSYLEWTDTRISLQIPEDVGSGMVYVITSSGQSDGVVFTNRNQIPVVLSQTEKTGEPHIESITPTKGEVGSLLTITGINFGVNRGNGKVLFTAIAPTSEVNAASESTEQTIAASDTDFDYESWNDQLIRVRVPDGSTSGNVHVENDRGSSNAVYFEVTDVAGTKTLRQKRGYQIQLSVEVSGVDAGEPNTLDLWLPGVLHLPQQRNIEFEKKPDPVSGWGDFLGLSRFEFSNLTPGATYTVNQTFWFDRYTIETKINASQVRRNYDTDRKLYKVFTAPETAIPSDNKKIVDAARSAVGRQTNPYLQAEDVYEYILKRLSYTDHPPGKNIVDDLAAGKGDSYDYSMLFCAMARSLGIPARPIAGFLIYGEKYPSPSTWKSAVYYWAEFYLAGFGWVPVDPTLGDNADFDGFPTVDNPAAYYFGDIDSQHIAFTRGIVPVKAIVPQSKTFQQNGVYSLQTIDIETSQSIKSFQTHWSGLTIIDAW